MVALRTGLVVFFLSCGIAEAAAQGPTPESVSPTLDAYAAGDFRRVAAQLERIADPATFLVTFRRDAAEWIAAADRDARPARRLIAAAVALEATARHLEEWQLGRDLMEWGAGILAADPPRDAERIWYLTAVALSQHAFSAWDVAVQARNRFPDEDRFHLAPAIVQERLSWRATQFDSPDARVVLGNLVRAFEPLLARGTIRAEAHLRLGHTRLRMGDHTAALEHFSRVPAFTREPFLLYLAHYFTGRAKQARGDRPAAATAYAAALEIVPRAQSASLSLAVLAFARDDRDRAFGLVAGSVSGTEPVDDPWRMYQAADSRFLPALIGMLRSASR